MSFERRFSPWLETEISDLGSLKNFFLRHLQGLNAKTCYLFYGEMGVGKTESVKIISSLLGAGDASSPSFALHQAYGIHSSSTAASAVSVIHHIDLYRLESEDDIESSGFWDLFQDSQALIIIEWPERINIEWLPLNWRIEEFYFSVVAQASTQEQGTPTSRVLRYRTEV